ncbi:MAG: hypothetical protein IPO80_04850 [Propionibacteriaceae bacterium]|nr:hypothetical protein [Propionibacteriaceae bacterium]
MALDDLPVPFKERVSDVRQTLNKTWDTPQFGPLAYASAMAWRGRQEVTYIAIRGETIIYASAATGSEARSKSIAEALMTAALKRAQASKPISKHIWSCNQDIDSDYLREKLFNAYGDEELWAYSPSFAIEARGLVVELWAVCAAEKARGVVDTVSSAEMNDLMNSWVDEEAFA